MRRKKYTEIEFNAEEDLPLKKMLELYNMIIIVRSVFYEDKKYYLQVFLS